LTIHYKLLDWIQEEVKAELTSLPTSPITLTLEQIKEIIQSKEPKIIPFSWFIKERESKKRQKR
jgi:hypothetical protein